MALKNNTPPQMLKESISFFINGESYTVADLASYTTLNTFIREHARLKGTKFMCLEGACGSCIVSVSDLDPVTQKERIFSVNSCLVYVYQCQGWSVTTIEELGNRFVGYNDIQTRLAEHNGTQCGACTPGMIMTMYSLLQSSKLEGTALTMQKIEDSFNGNICRCTGYRPILDAFKTFASDAPAVLREDQTENKDICKALSETVIKAEQKTQNSEHKCSCASKGCSKLQKTSNLSFLKLELEDNAIWYHVSTLEEIFEIFAGLNDNSYMLIHGNTAKGVLGYTEYPNVYIDVRRVPELHTSNNNDGSLRFGGNITLANFIAFLSNIALTDSTQFVYASGVVDHLDLVANVAVRNNGSLSGNLMIKHDHREFYSDVFLILETVGAVLNIQEMSGQVYSMSPLNFLDMDMNKKVIKEIVLPQRPDYTYKSYKILRVAQNDRAIVNAGFLFKFDQTNEFQVLEKPNIVFGGIEPNFVHAVNTEEFVVGKRLLNVNDLAEVLNVLSSELNPDISLADGSPEYRKGLALSLFYKFVLSLSPENIDPRLRSGGESLSRPLASPGQYNYTTNESIWPITQPVQKVEALRQCSGEAQYVNDLPNLNKQLYGALVLSTISPATGFTIDATAALSMPGVVGFYTANDIPGKNSFMTSTLSYVLQDEVVLVSQDIEFTGQPLGVIVATTRDEARIAAAQVNVQYSGVGTPVTDFLEIIRNNDTSRMTQAGSIEPTASQGSNTQFTISGTFTLRSQYHYTMETQTCFCVPVEDGMDVYPATQWPSMIQETVSLVLNIPQDRWPFRPRSGHPQ